MCYTHIPYSVFAISYLIVDQQAYSSLSLKASSSAKALGVISVGLQVTSQEGLGVRKTGTPNRQKLIQC